MQKIFLDVYAHFTKDGDMEPVCFVWENGKKYKIDKVCEKKRSASLKVGGQGIRYKCRVLGKEIYLFYEDGKWFFET